MDSVFLVVFFFQAEDGIRDLVRSRGLGDVYKRQLHLVIVDNGRSEHLGRPEFREALACIRCGACLNTCLLYTSDAADERSSVDLGGRRIIKKKKRSNTAGHRLT